LLAQNTALTALEADRLLGLTKSGEIKSWLGKMQENGIISSQGITNNTQYYIEPKILQKVSFVSSTNLKKIAPHRLRELIYTDIKDYPCSSIGEIHDRVGKEINRRRIRTILENMRLSGEIVATGEKRWTRYSIAGNASNLDKNVNKTSIENVNKDVK
jgi:ATP-dependent DNA helicase RecG